MKKITIFIFILLIFSTSNSICQFAKWAKAIQGGKYIFGKDLVIDQSGNIIVVGSFNSSTIDFNNGITLSNNGEYDGFIAKYNSSGVCLWAKKIGGTKSDSVRNINIDKNNNIYVIGDFSSDTLYFNNGKSLNMITDFSKDAFLAKFDSNGVCQWAERIAGKYTDDGIGITVDNFSNIYVTGEYRFSDTIYFNNGIQIINEMSERNVYLAKYNSNGVCQWAERIAGDKNDYVQSITIDNNGSIYLTGNFVSDTLYFNNSIFLKNTNKDYTDIYIAKYNSNGICQWVDKIGGTNNEYVNCIKSDKNNNIYLTGYFGSNTLTFNNSISLKNTRYLDVFLTKYNSSGGCQWAKKISGANHEYGMSVTVDGNGNVYTAGAYQSNPIEFDNSISLAYFSIGLDAYIAKFNNDGICQWAENIIHGGNYLLSIATNDLGNNLYVLGSFGSNYIEFSNGVKVNRLISSVSNAFFAKLVSAFPIELSKGWNLISSNVKPDLPDSINIVMKDISSNIALVKNNFGRAFIPSLNINQIGKWDFTQGYFCYMLEADKLYISGDEIDPLTSSIQVEAGWNTISYFLKNETPIELALKNLTDNDNLILVKTIDGKSYIPAYNINTIINMKPGVGYQIYIKRNELFKYNIE